MFGVFDKAYFGIYGIITVVRLDMKHSEHKIYSHFTILITWIIEVMNEFRIKVPKGMNLELLRLLL